MLTSRLPEDQPCPVCGYPIETHVGRKACLPAVATGAKSLHDLPIFGWAWSEDAKEIGA